MQRRLSPIARAVGAAGTASALSAALVAAASYHRDAATVQAVAVSRSCRPAVTRLPDLGHGGTAESFTGSVVVGSVDDARGQDHPAIWRHGSLTVLRTSVIRNGEANDINSRGLIVGDADNFTAAWELRGRRVIILRDVPGSHSVFARRINAHGQIAGAAGRPWWAAPARRTA